MNEAFTLRETEPQVLTELEQSAVDFYDAKDDLRRESLKRVLMQNVIENVCVGGGIQRDELHGNTEHTLSTALEIVSALKRDADSHKRRFDSDIEVVHVLSGPGTYLQPLTDTQYNERHNRWCGRDRTRAAVAVAMEIAASRIGRLLQTENINSLGQHSPFIFHNGQSFENDALRLAITQRQAILSRLPNEKFIISDGYRNAEGDVQPITNTSHQTMDLFQQIENGSLQGVHNIAVVAHIPDMIRIPFYLQKDYEAYLQRGGDPLRFWVYALRGRRGSENSGRGDTIPKHMVGELTRLVKYLKGGYLASEPCKFENLDLPL